MAFSLFKTLQSFIPESRDDEIHEGVVLSWDYMDIGVRPPPIRYRIYTIKLSDSRIKRVKEEKLLELENDDNVLVIVPRGNWGQAYLSEKRSQGTGTLPNDDYLEIIKML